MGSAFLVMAVVGSGIMGEQLADKNMAIALIANTITTTWALYVLITLIGPISGAHFNPAVTIFSKLRGELPTWGLTLGYMGSQLLGALLGILLTHLMFDLPVYQTSEKVRNTWSLISSECVATSGLLLTIYFGNKFAKPQVPILVASYIGSAYWFTSSTSFANPMMAFARSLTNTFSGIRPVDAPAFAFIEFLTAVILAILINTFSSEFFRKKNSQGA